jgi:prepilin-type N-terminal cleavage/methylation domain-containing protein
MTTSHHPVVPNVGLRLWKRADARAATGGPNIRRAFSLIEILITVALLSVIILGLVAMFNQVRRAFTSSLTQVDVLEAGRATTEMIARELEQIVPAHIPFTTNFYANVSYTPSVQPLNDPADLRTNVLEQVFFLTRYSQQWSGIGYRVSTPNLGYGTLYKFTSNNIPQANVPRAAGDFQNTFLTNMNRIADGVVHFKVRAFDTNGVLLTTAQNYKYITPEVNPFYLPTYPDLYDYTFTSNAVPAYLELELGILEARTAERLKSLGGNPVLSQDFISKHAAQIHVFRQRISIRNVDPDAYK